MIPVGARRRLSGGLRLEGSALVLTQCLDEILQLLRIQARDARQSLNSIRIESEWFGIRLWWCTSRRTPRERIDSARGSKLPYQLSYRLFRWLDSRWCPRSPEDGVDIGAREHYLDTLVSLLLRELCRRLIRAVGYLRL